MRRNEDPDAILLGGILVMILAFLDSSCAWIAGIMFILLGIKSMMNNPVFSKKVFGWHNLGCCRKRTRIVAGMKYILTGWVRNKRGE